ncbi:cytochrome P450 CYP749A22-like [Gossypium arboreum]|uniref:cytochrome P450 CYP749A22-like n=1 Tax=Gossypium arboreum TaxID=29729 RepID=UPI00081973B2|nr:cytochrome P450 CYP749A22-like [Gossypium arboreum]
MALQMMMGKGALPGKGLGRQLQEEVQIPKLIEKKDRFGLGFTPDYKHKRQEIEKRQARRKARLNGREAEWELMTFPPISKSFKSGGLLIKESHQVNSVHNEGLEQGSLEGKNFLYWNGVRAELVISEPELAKEVLKNNEKAFPKRTATIYGRKLLGNGIVFIEGEKWAKHRKLANYAFHGESLKNMTPTIIASVETMMKKWKGQEGKGIEVFHEFRLLTSEVISRTAFGSNKIWKTADLLESEKLEKGIHDCVLEIVKKRENKFVSGEVDGFGNDFLGLLVNAYHDLNDKSMLSMEDLVDECKTFYFAGQETVNFLLAWTILLIAIHGDWQEKARGEVIDIFGNQNPYPEGIAKLKIMTMIINETLRLYSQPSGMMRKVEKEVRLGKLVLPANIDLQIASIAFHCSPQLWGDDVHLFKPERFAKGVAKATNYNAAAFFPFGLGPRSCVGMTFATTEAKIALSMILQRYSFTLSPTYVHSPISPLTL